MRRPWAFLAFLGRFSLLSRRRPSKPRNSRERPALDDRVRYLGLLAAYLPCGRVSQVAAKEARPPTRALLLAPKCHRRMDAASHQKRQWSARADIRSYLRSASSREHARILGFDGLQHAGRERPTNNKRGAGSKAVRGGRCFLRLDGAAEDGPSAHDRGSSGD